MSQSYHSKMLSRLGILITILFHCRDASWELEPNAYNSLLEQKVECEAEQCVCEGGRASDQIGTVYYHVK